MFVWSRLRLSTHTHRNDGRRDPHHVVTRSARTAAHCPHIHLFTFIRSINHIITRRTSRPRHAPSTLTLAAIATRLHLRAQRTFLTTHIISRHTWRTLAAHQRASRSSYDLCPAKGLCLPLATHSPSTFVASPPRRGPPSRTHHTYKMSSSASCEDEARRAYATRSPPT